MRVSTSFSVEVIRLCGSRRWPLPPRIPYIKICVAWRKNAHCEFVLARRNACCENQDFPVQPSPGFRRPVQICQGPPPRCQPRALTCLDARIVSAGHDRSPQVRRSSPPNLVRRIGNGALGAAKDYRTIPGRTKPSWPSATRLSAVRQSRCVTAEVMQVKLLLFGPEDAGKAGLLLQEETRVEVRRGGGLITRPFSQAGGRGNSQSGRKTTALRPPRRRSR